MRDNYDFSDAIQNPFAKKLKEEGYSVLIYYSPEDVEKKCRNKEYAQLTEEKDLSPKQAN